MACLLTPNLQLPYMSLIGSLHATWQLRDTCGSCLGPLSVRNLHNTSAFSFCCGQLLSTPVPLQGRLLYPESGRMRLLSSSLHLLLPPSLLSLFPLPSTVRIRPKERRSKRLALPFAPLFSLPPAPRPEDGRAIYLVGLSRGRCSLALRVLLLPSLRPSLALCSSSPGNGLAVTV